MRALVRCTGEESVIRVQTWGCGVAWECENRRRAAAARTRESAYALAPAHAVERAQAVPLLVAALLPPVYAPPESRPAPIASRSAAAPTRARTPRGRVVLVTLAPAAAATTHAATCSTAAAASVELAGPSSALGRRRSPGMSVCARQFFDCVGGCAGGAGMPDGSDDEAAVGGAGSGWYGAVMAESELLPPLCCA